MTTMLHILLAASCLVIAGQPVSKGADDDKAALQGVWLAQSMEADGKAVPGEDAKRMRLTFKEGKLFIRGNFKDDREQECPYKIDPEQSPKHLDFTPPKEKKPVLAIYEVKGGELKICVRHASSSEGRPTELATKPESQLVLMVFKKQKP